MTGWDSAAALAAAPIRSRYWVKASIDAEATSHWGGAWTNSAVATTPGQAYTNNAEGLGVFPTIDPVRKFITRAGAHDFGNPSPGTFWVCDRLVGVGELELTATGTKTVNSTALPRYTNGDGVMVFAMAATAVGSTNIPVMRLSSYTNQDGTSSRSATDALTWVGATTDIGHVTGPFPLQGGDTGVRSVESVEVTTASAGTTAKFHIFLLRPLIMLDLENGGQMFTEHDTMNHLHHLRRIYDGASLVALIGGYTGSEETNGSLTVALDV
ncbi:MAG TPA: hypothetical protein VFU85_11200 [Nocardioides sp.]|nr:hypothetical protein [Nocardioides sp.]